MLGLLDVEEVGNGMVGNELESFEDSLATLGVGDIWILVGELLEGLSVGLGSGKVLVVLAELACSDLPNLVGELLEVVDVVVGHLALGIYVGNWKSSPATQGLVPAVLHDPSSADLTSGGAAMIHTNGAKSFPKSASRDWRDQGRFWTRVRSMMGFMLAWRQSSVVLSQGPGCIM